MNRTSCFVCALAALFGFAAVIYAAMPSRSIATSRMLGEPTTSTTATTLSGPLPGASTTSVTVSSPTTSSTLDLAVLCGDASGDNALTASDALAALTAAVGATLCDACICDADGSGSVAASDALLILRLAVGNPLASNCPPCAGR